MEDSGRETRALPDFTGVRAVFFDLDDTLCAYWEAARHGLRRAFELHGPEGYTPEEMALHWAKAFRQFVREVKADPWYEQYLKSGEPTRTEQMRRTLLAIGVVDEDRAKALSRAYASERDAALRLFEDSRPVLERLHGKYALGLITNGPADVQRQEIATLGIEHFFDTILIEGEMGEGKPSAEVFRLAERSSGRKPEQILFVGNSYAHDIVPAIKAGWRTAWIRRASDIPPSAAPGGSPVEVAPEGGPHPDAVIGELRELLTMLEAAT